jgi:hypothetical protein
MATAAYESGAVRKMVGLLCGACQMELLAEEETGEA